jgi:hypothetical protein
MAPVRTQGRRSVGFAAWVLVGALLPACGGSAAVRAADRGDLGALRIAMDRERSQGKLDAERARTIARAVAAREIRAARAEQALLRIDEAAACARSLEGPLEERARGSGDAAAEAELLLLDTREGRADGPSFWRKYGEDPNPLWRAVAARAQVGAGRANERRRAFVDVDERVRLASLRAALDAADATDARALLEAARLDPNPLARALAARAAGGIAKVEVVIGLHDLYASADEGLRQSIVGAWARPPAASAGGVRELEQVAASERGAPAIEAAARLLARGGTETGLAEQVLLRAMAAGLTRDRILAATYAPAGRPRVRDALERLRRDPDVPLRTAVLLRLSELPSARKAAQVELRAMADEGSAVAILALARTGDAWAVQALARDLNLPRAGARLAAGRSLASMEQAPRASILLADADPHVRMTIACAILGTRAP